MTFLQAPLGVRSYVSSLIAFISLTAFSLILCSVSLLLSKDNAVLPPQAEMPPMSSVELDRSRGGGGGGSCDLSSGRWVYDNSTRPLYSGLGCSFMHDEVACEKYGRSDLRYQHWRWQPHACDLPRFAASKIHPCACSCTPKFMSATVLLSC